MPLVLPDFDDDPATESLDHLDTPFPPHLKVVRELPAQADRSCYEVVHTVLERVLLLEVAQQAGCERFAVRMERYARLLQPGAPGLLDAGVLADGRRWCVRPGPEGTPLAQQVRSMTTSGMVVLFQQVAGVLAAAHANHFAHGALSADCILVLPAGQVMVYGWSEGERVDDVRALAELLQSLLRGNLPPRLQVVVTRALNGGYPQAGAFGEALVDVLQVR